MFLLIILSFLVLYRCEVSANAPCNDCVSLRSCQAALDYASKNRNDAENRSKLTESFCGTEFVNGFRAPKVCCSDFKEKETLWVDPGIEFNNDTSNNEIEMHENLNLLPESCGNIEPIRILAGNVGLYEFPWLALIAYKIRPSSGNYGLQFKCGGSIINSRYILTAAHCVVNQKIAGVRIGEFDIRTNNDCQGEYPKFVCESHTQDIYVEEIIPHEQYQRSPVENDIALLRLKTPINLTFKNAKPICLPLHKELRERNVTGGDKIGTVAGWGLTGTGIESVVLRKVNIPVLSDATCREFYNKTNGQGDRNMLVNKLCAREDNKDFCTGDPGGPLMLEDEVKGIDSMIQYGIVSYGPRQCGSEAPGVYTDVTKYIKWILDNIKP